MTPTILGSIVSLWRYPVKSVLGKSGMLLKSPSAGGSGRSTLLFCHSFLFLRFCDQSGEILKLSGDRKS